MQTSSFLSCNNRLVELQFYSLFLEFFMRYPEFPEIPTILFYTSKFWTILLGQSRADNFTALILCSNVNLLGGFSSLAVA